MNVGLVTTWGTACGIATYSEQLSVELLAAGVNVTALAANEPGVGIRAASSVPYEPLWDRSGRGLGAGNDVALAEAVRRLQLDVVHFQHEHGLFPSGVGFLQCCNAIRKAGAKVVVTLHTLFPYGQSRTGWHNDLRFAVDVIVTHTAAGRAAMLVATGTAPVVMIPHGTPTIAAGNREQGLGLLGLTQPAYKDAVICTVLGFQNEGKNLVHTIKCFSEALSRRWMTDRVVLLIIGSGADENPTYVTRHVPWAIADSGYEINIQQRNRFVPFKDISHILAATDFGVLNTRSTTLSASGQVHQYAAAGVPLAVADRPIYVDAVMAGAVPFHVVDRSPEEPTLSAITAIAALGRDGALRSDIGDRLRRFGERTSWSKVAARTVELYKAVLQ